MISIFLEIALKLFSNKLILNGFLNFYSKFNYRIRCRFLIHLPIFLGHLKQSYILKGESLYEQDSYLYNFSVFFRLGYS